MILPQMQHRARAGRDAGAPCFAGAPFLEKPGPWTVFLFAMVACSGDPKSGAPPISDFVARDGAAVNARDGGAGIDVIDRAEHDHPDATSGALDGSRGDDDSGSGRAEAGRAAATEWTCNADHAYWAPSSIQYTDPTPPPLADALIAISKGHAISLVLHLKDDGLWGALSATIAGPRSDDVFPPDETPPFAAAVPAFGSPPGVTSVNPQPNAFLHFTDERGPVEIPIVHLVWRATEGADCDDMSVSVQAVIPSSQTSLILHLSDGDHTIGELSNTAGGIRPIGDPQPPTVPIEIGFQFQGVPMTFDFSTLPGAE
jgi:hypothetical protein